jgi:hypothetical protein
MNLDTNIMQLEMISSLYVLPPKHHYTFNAEYVEPVLTVSHSAFWNRVFCVILIVNNDYFLKQR